MQELKGTGISDGKREHKPLTRAPLRPYFSINKEALKLRYASEFISVIEECVAVPNSAYAACCVTANAVKPVEENMEDSYGRSSNRSAWTKKICCMGEGGNVWCEVLSLRTHITPRCFGC